MTPLTKTRQGQTLDTHSRVAKALGFTESSGTRWADDLPQPAETTGNIGAKPIDAHSGAEGAGP